MSRVFALLKWPEEDYLYLYDGDQHVPFEDGRLDLDSEVLLNPPHQIEAFCKLHSVELQRDVEKPYAFRFVIGNPESLSAFIRRFKISVAS